MRYWDSMETDPSRNLALLPSPTPQGAQISAPTARVRKSEIPSKTLCTGYKETRIPEELATVHQYFGHVFIGFLGKCLDGIKTSLLQLLLWSVRVYRLDIPIPCLGVCGLNAEGDDVIAILRAAWR